jgi:thiamine kinase-like enzyme
MTHEQIIKEVTSQVFDTNLEDVTVVERLMGGMSNYTYVIDINSKKYTFRIPGKNADKFVDRVNEQKNINLVNTLGLNNNTLFLDVETGYKIAEYIEGQPLSELNPLDYLNKAASVLHKIHESGLQASKDYDPKGRLALYESHLAEYDYKHTNRYLTLKKNWEKLSNKYMDKERLALSHGDAQISNFLVTDNGLRLMDWEFTGNNDPFYDIACFGNNDFNHAVSLLPVYLGKKPTTEDYNRLYFYRAFQCLQWHNVALYKEFIGLSVDLGVDFMFVSNLYLDKTEKFLNSIE